MNNTVNLGSSYLQSDSQRQRTLFSPWATSLGDVLWRPRRVYRSAEDWAAGTGNHGSLLPLPESAPHGVVARLAGGKVIGDMRLIASRENDVLGQLQILHGIDAPESHWPLQQWRLRRPRRLSGLAVTLAAAPANYFHWLFDSLPRLHLLRLAGVAWSQVESFLLNGTVHTFDVDSLKVLGIPPERVVRCSKREVTVAEQLVVPPMPTPRSGEISGWMCDFLRESFLAESKPAAFNPKLYLSRRNSAKRRLANEAEIERFFCEHGFQSVRLEEFTFREQIQIFAQAAFVAGPHGAGFANLVFAPRGTKVIELFHPRHQQPVYQYLAAGLGMEYQRVVGAAPDEQLPEMSERLGPYTIELDQVKKLI